MNRGEIIVELAKMIAKWIDKAWSARMTNVLTEELRKDLRLDSIIQILIMIGFIFRITILEVVLIINIMTMIILSYYWRGIKI